MTISNSQFLARLLDGADGYGWVCAFPGNPASPETAKWFGKPWLPGEASSTEVDGYSDRNSYFGVAELKAEGNKRARRKQNFKRLRALVVDDVIDSSLAGDPTYVLETSPGKVQAGVFIDPEDPDAADAAVVDAVMSELYERKLLGDNSGNNLVRYVRLPQGVNQKPRESGHFQHQLLVWNPGIVYGLADACAVFGIDLDEVRTRARPAATGDAVVFGDVQQPEILSRGVHDIITGASFHQSLLKMSASLASSGLQPGANVNLMRALMEAAQVPRDGRWSDRYNDIPRTVEGAALKFQGRSWAPRGEPVEEEPLLAHVSELLADDRPIQWLVKDWVEEGALSCLFGPSGVGKSFIAYDMALHVATGRPWHGKPVRQGPVLLVVGEGKDGVKRRMKAWAHRHGVDIKDAPIHVTRRAVQFLDRAEAIKLVQAIVETLPKTGGPPVLIVIDTLARNFGPGDENSAKDASAFVAVVDELLRQEFGAHVMVVHHSGHEAGRARGSSAFKAAWDQEFAATPIAAADLVRFSATKMKDAEKPHDMEFKLNEIIYAEVKGNKVGSLVIEKMSSEWDEVLATPKSGIIVTVGWMLERMVGQYLLSRNQLMEQHGLTHDAAATAIEGLKALGYVEKDGAHANARLKLSESGKLLISRAGRAFGKDLDDHNGHAAADDGLGEGKA